MEERKRIVDEIINQFREWKRNAPNPGDWSRFATEAKVATVDGKEAVITY